MGLLTDPRQLLAAQIRAQYQTGQGGSGSWDDAGVDHALQLADLLIYNGITDLGDLSFVDTPYDIPARPAGQVDSGDGQVWDGGSEAGTGINRQLKIGDKTVGFLGDYNNDGTYGSKSSPYLQSKTGPDGQPSEDLLGWSARGEGNTSYRIVTDPKTGKLHIAPGWNSSSDAATARQAAIATLGMVAMAYGVTGTLAQAMNATGAAGLAVSGFATGAGTNMFTTQEVGMDTLKAGVIGASTAVVGGELKELIGGAGTASNFGNPEIDNLIPQVDASGNLLGQTSNLGGFDVGEQVWNDPYADSIQNNPAGTTSPNPLGPPSNLGGFDVGEQVWNDPSFDAAANQSNPDGIKTLNIDPINQGDNSPITHDPLNAPVDPIQIPGGPSMPWTIQNYFDAAKLGIGAISLYKAFTSDDDGPDMTTPNRLVDEQITLGRDSLQFSKDIYADSKERQVGIDAINANAITTATNLGREAGDRAKDSWDFYLREGRPMVQSTINDARNWDAEASLDKVTGQAKSTVEQNFADIQQQNFRTLQRMGVNPNSGRFAALNNQVAMQKALASSDAMNSARDDRKTQAVGLRQQASNLTQGFPAQSMGFGSQSMQGANSAANVAGIGGAQNNTIGANALSGMAMSSNIFGNAASQASANSMNQYNAQSANQHGWGNLAGYMFGDRFADGGKVQGPGTGTSDSVQAVNTDSGQRVQLSNGEYVVPTDVVKALGTKYFDNLIEKHHKPVNVGRAT